MVAVGVGLISGIIAGPCESTLSMNEGATEERSIRSRLIEKHILPGLAVPQADMEMAAAAGMAGEGLGHEGGDQSRAVGDLLHAVLEGKGLVGGREVRAGAVDCLELGAAILQLWVTTSMP